MIDWKKPLKNLACKDWKSAEWTSIVWSGWLKERLLVQSGCGLNDWLKELSSLQHLTRKDCKSAEHCCWFDRMIIWFELVVESWLRVIGGLFWTSAGWQSELTVTCCGPDWAVRDMMSMLLFNLWWMMIVAELWLLFICFEWQQNLVKFNFVIFSSCADKKLISTDKHRLACDGYICKQRGVMFIFSSVRR
jgi:hypothetical protein